MKLQSKRIIWADDEIDQLKAHIHFLKAKGYDVTPVTNGDDAIALVEQNRYDLVLLDEMMPGKDGLTTLTEIKNYDPNIPIIMITKNEEEHLMDEAIGKRIDDYLTKPVNPSQILSACKRTLESRTIRENRLGQDYAREFAQWQARRMGPMTPEDWIALYHWLCEWDVELDHYKDSDLKTMHQSNLNESNHEFCRYIERHYTGWIHQRETSPTLSVDVVKKYVAPHLRHGKPTYFIVMDCMRYDQWLMIEPLLNPYFSIERDSYYSILPTATPYSRNALFSGLFPLEIAEKYPHYWYGINGNRDEEGSKNRHERQLLERQLADLEVKINPLPKYIKVFTTEESQEANRTVASFDRMPLVAMVFNFMDILVHTRSELEVMREIAPDEAAFRALTRAWFEHSPVREMFQIIASQGATVVLTTDHGSVMGRRATTAYGNRDTSTSLRYKYGNNLNCDQKDAVKITNPTDYMLPATSKSMNYILAKEDYYFVYPTNYSEYKRQYADSFHHGGISMEEMIVPVVTLHPKP
ncbi:MAG: response regulator [Gemmatimonadetes bacterium]|nr:MAG: response regulator [Gemmatimonadota bacterium]